MKPLRLRSVTTTDEAFSPTDSLGRTQPLHRDPDRGTYMIYHLLPIEVEVK
jgi:hypothetical protein